MSSLVQLGTCSPQSKSWTSWGSNICSFSMGKTQSKPAVCGGREGGVEGGREGGREEGRELNDTSR